MSSKSKATATPRLVNQTYELVSINSIRPHPRNVNEGDLAVIAESMRVHGFYGALRVQRSSGYIVAGNHSWAAAKEIGIERVPVIMLDVDDDQALRLMLVDNATARASHNREQDLANLLIDIQKTPSALIGTGFDGKGLDDLLASLEKNTPRMDDEAAKPPESAPEQSECAEEKVVGNRAPEFRIVVDCQSEAHQTELLDRFESESLKCRPLSA